MRRKSARIRNPFPDFENFFSVKAKVVFLPFWLKLDNAKCIQANRFDLEEGMEFLALTGNDGS